jgi:ornithine carbamoyltransferase
VSEPSYIAAPAKPSFAAAELVTDADLSSGDLRTLLDVAAQIRKTPAPYSQALRGKTLVLLFEKPSLRTRITFEIAIQSLGGSCVFHDCRSDLLGHRESIADVARNLERWADVIAARTFRQSVVEDLARWARIPVINALSDRFHPCQALADVMTLRDVFGHLEGIKLAYAGDGNNVAHSLLLTGAQAGLHVAVATPAACAPDPEIVRAAAAMAARNGGSVSVGSDPCEAVSGAHAVYTDVWTSMGSEGEADARHAQFRPYQVTGELFAKARPDAIFLHCLPAHRGEEVVDAVIDSERSRVFDQAENRLHAQRALLWLLLAR